MFGLNIVMYLTASLSVAEIAPYANSGYVAKKKT